MKRAVLYIFIRLLPRILFLIITGISIGIITIIYILSTLESDKIKHELESYLSGTTGREISVDGEFDFRIDPLSQSIVVNDLSFIDTEGETTILTADTIKLEIDILELFYKNLVVNYLDLSGVSIDLDNYERLKKLSRSTDLPVVREDREDEDGLEEDSIFTTFSFKFEKIFLEDIKVKRDNSIIFELDGLEFSRRQEDSTSIIDFQVIYRKEKMNGIIQSYRIQDGGDLRFTLNLALPTDSRIDLEGFLVLGQTFGDIELKGGFLDSQINDLDYILRWTGGKGFRLSPTTVRSDVSFANGAFNFKNIELASNINSKEYKNSLNGNIEFIMTDTIPLVKADLYVDRFKFKEVFMRKGKERERQFTHDTLDLYLSHLRLLESFNLEGSVKIDYLEFNRRLPISNLDLSLNMYDGKFATNEITLDLYNGDFSGYVRGDFSSRNKIGLPWSEWSFSIKSLSLESLNGLMSEGSFEGGLLDIGVSSRVEGRSAVELLSSMSLNLDIDLVEKGSAKDINSYLAGTDFFTKLFSFNYNKDIELNCLKLSSKFYRGKVNSDTFKFGVETSRSNIVSYMNLDLGKWQIKSTIATKPTRGLSYSITSELMRLVQIEGPINSPKVNFSIFNDSKLEENNGLFKLNNPLKMVSRVLSSGVRLIPGTSYLASFITEGHPCKSIKENPITVKFDSYILDEELSVSNSIIMNKTISDYITINRLINREINKR
ncbi:MAG: hypothetical protein JJV96_01285 [Alphaproteobacteria bacterium]|nr:hypothetical protein [Alphaproteobacteria bacterium]